MAEGMFNELVEDEEEKTEVEARVAFGGAEAFAAAVAAIASRQDPAVARKTATFLDHQSHLLTLQAKHLEDEHALRLAHLRNQLREERIRRVGMRLRVGILVLLVAVAGAIVIGALAAIHSAMNAHDVAIDTFQVPPDLAQRGLTGEVIAKQVLDQLTDMTVATSTGSARPANSYSSGWGHDLKVDTPETGVSLGGLNRYLREALGHESHISGEVFETSTGITVTARAGEEPAKSFSGRTEDLDQLVRKSAEAIYEQMQPFRFANYLYFEGRYNESIPIVKRLSHDPNPVERAWALQALGTIALANEDGDLAQFAADERAALEALPGLLRARESLAWAELRLGHDAEAVEMATQCVTASPASEATVAPAWHSFFAAECLAVKSSLEGDYPAVLDAAASLSEQDRVRVNFLPDPLITGPLSTHDLDVVPNDSWYATLATVAAGPMAMLIENARNFDLARNALERGEPGAVELLNKVCAFDNTLGKKRSHDYMLRVHGLWLALAKAKFGDLAGGQAMIAETPMDCRMCVDFRGRIAALAGNTADAEQWFAEAIEMAPKLPQVYIDRGQARLDRAELDGALADASEAATLSPHDGDAWKLWGDVLAKQGHAMEALAKYDEALKYAPQWKQLQEAREAAGKQGT